GWRPEGAHELVVLLAPLRRQRGSDRREVLERPAVSVASDLFLGRRLSFPLLCADPVFLDVGAGSDPAEDLCLILRGQPTELLSREQPIFPAEVAARGGVEERPAREPLGDEPLGVLWIGPEEMKRDARENVPSP